jgi:hypothetical protein
LAEKGAGREFSDRKKEIVSDGIRGVKIKHLERRSRRLDTGLKLARNEGRNTEDLLLEKQFILDELQALQGVMRGEKDKIGY